MLDIDELEQEKQVLELLTQEVEQSLVKVKSLPQSDANFLNFEIRVGLTLWQCEIAMHSKLLSQLTEANDRIRQLEQQLAESKLKSDEPRP